MTGVGETLRGAREEMELSYQDVEESIKIRAVYLRAIEEERFEELPGAAYTKGFMRSYAKFLGLDGDAVIAAYLSSAAAVPEEPAPSAPRRLQTARPAFRRTALLATAAVAVIIVIVLSFYFNPVEQKPIADPPGVSEQNQPEGETTPPVTPEEPEEPAEPEIIEGLVVEVAYSAPCWLDVRADGEPVFSGTKGEGESLRIEANEYVEFVSIGATEAITITKNGELLPGFTEHVTRNFRVIADVPRLAPPDGGQDE
ncbi:MAG: helix-turn-helix domain-containing protein [Gracilibacteraceae bacterium]|jgi:hypothetical protein|nr:helix-turn-helix domain-containing protein [Gracilibacteraceae bacterium]